MAKGRDNRNREEKKKKKKPKDEIAREAQNISFRHHSVVAEKDTRPPG